YLQEPSQLKPVLEAKTQSKTDRRKSRNNDDYIVVRNESVPTNTVVANTATPSSITTESGSAPALQEETQRTESVSTPVSNQTEITEVAHTQVQAAPSEIVVAEEPQTEVKVEKVKKEEPKKEEEEPQDEFSRLQRKLDKIV